jgi:glucosamine--fructose-6-phosphate aminotransferase (isomerizing)
VKNNHLKNDESATYKEILTQTIAWEGAISNVMSQAAALRALWDNGQFNQVVFSGCGSTYYLSLAAAALWQSLIDVPAKGAPGGELYLYPEATYSPAETGRTLLVAVSRSGTTSETVAATKRFKADNRGQVVVISNYGDTPLAQLGDVVIDLPEGQEESVAQTRSFASMYVAVTAVTALLAGRDELLAAMHRIPDAGRQLLTAYETEARSVGENLALDRFYFLGSGPRYGLACEVNLKMKEMSLTHSEPFHFMEFRHGPMSMVNERALIVGLLSGKNRAYEQAVLEEMKDLGGRVLTVGPAGADISFDDQLPAAISNVLYLPALQLLAYYRAVAKGLNPDRPTNLTAVIELDLA